MYIVDSGVWIGAFNPKDAHYGKAAGIVEAISRGKLGRALITSFIFGEVVTYVRRKIGPERATEVARAMLDSKHVEILHIDGHMFNAGCHIFEVYPRLSFADSVSAAVMEDTGIRHIISFDSGFDGVRDIIRLESVPQR